MEMMMVMMIESNKDEYEQYHVIILSGQISSCE